MATLNEDRKTILKLLVALAWADGRVTPEEMEIVDALLDAFEASTEAATEIREWAKTPKTLDDVDVAGLHRSSLILALQHGVLLTYIDGEQSDNERKLIGDLVRKIGFSSSEAAPLLESAEMFAKSLLPELSA